MARTFADGASDAGAPGDLQAALEKLYAALPGNQQAYARGLGQAELAAVAAHPGSKLSGHGVHLLTNTIQVLLRRPSPSPEEKGFRTAWIKWVTERLLDSPVTESETAELKTQIKQLGDRFVELVRETTGADETATAQVLPEIDGMVPALTEAAESLMAGGPLHPLPEQGMGKVADAFAQGLRDARAGDRLTMRVMVASSASLIPFYSLSLKGGPQEFPPDVQTAWKQYTEANRRKAEDDRKRDLDKFERLSHQ